jgi:single-strand DNA-binding protein
MASFNKVILLGNLTHTPELRYSEAGRAWMSFGMAVNDKYKTKDGEEVERVEFVDVTASGNQAEVIAKYLDKGSPLLIEGRLTQDKWEGEDGKPRKKTRVRMSRFHFVPGGKRREEAAAA